MAHETAARVATAARAILIEQGAAAVTMRRVAEAVGITAMAIYKHYPNRDALLRAVADEAFQELAKGWGKRFESDDFEARLAGLLEDFLNFALGTPHLYTFLITDQREQVRRFPEEFREGGSPAFTPVLELVQSGISQGLLKTDDPLEVTLSLTSSAQGLVQLYLGGRIGMNESDFRSLCKRTIWRVLDGIRA
jgi:AcrR family transcriptional regulator